MKGGASAGDIKRSTPAPARSAALSLAESTPGPGPATRVGFATGTEALSVPGRSSGGVAVAERPASPEAERAGIARPDVIKQCDLTKKILAYDPKADTSLIDTAYHLATQAHGTSGATTAIPTLRIRSP